MGQTQTTMNRQLLLPLALCVLMCAVHSLDASNTVAEKRSAYCGVLYEHAHFRGRRYNIRGYGTRFVGHFNDKTSSIRVNNGWTMIVYQHAYFRGHKYYIRRHSSWLGGFNDKTSSLKVNKGWTMYVFKHANYRGRRLAFGPGNYNMYRLRKMGNDSISSVYCKRR